MNPVAWSTTPDFVDARLFNENALVDDYIAQNYSLYASWPSPSVYLIYNVIGNPPQKELVKSNFNVKLRDDITYGGFACWNDISGNPHLPGSKMHISQTTNLFMSCYYKCICRFDLNGGYMKSNTVLLPRSGYASRYVDVDFEEDFDAASIQMPYETPQRDDGAFFKWWVVNDQLLQPDEAASIIDDSTAIATYHFNATYSFNDSINISGAGVIASTPEVETDDAVKKTYSATANSGYVFKSWSIESFNGSKTTKSNATSSKIEVSLRKLPSAEIRINTYVNVTAMFDTDSSWTAIYINFDEIDAKSLAQHRVHYVDGTMKTFRVIGNATDAELKTKGNANVKRVVFGKSVAGIEKDLFKGCVKLEEVRMHSNMWQFGMNVFEGCVSLRNVVFM